MPTDHPPAPPGAAERIAVALSDYCAPDMDGWSDSTLAEAIAREIAQAGYVLVPRETLEQAVEAMSDSDAALSDAVEANLLGAHTIRGRVRSALASVRAVLATEGRATGGKE